MLDPAGRYLRINELIARNNGPSPAEHVGRTLEEVLGESAPAVRAQLEQTLAQGTPVTGQDVVVRDVAGVARTWQVTWFPARAPETGRIVAAVCVASDVTDTRRDELERRRAQEWTRSSARSGELLAAGLGTDQVLDAVVDLLVAAARRLVRRDVTRPRWLDRGGQGRHDDPEQRPRCAPSSTASPSPRGRTTGAATRSRPVAPSACPSSTRRSWRPSPATTTRPSP